MGAIFEVPTANELLYCSIITLSFHCLFSSLLAWRWMRYSAHPPGLHPSMRILGGKRATKFIYLDSLAWFNPLRVAGSCSGSHASRSHSSAA